MIRNKKTLNIFDHYYEYIGWRYKSPKTANTFTHFVKSISNPKKQNSESLEVCQDINLLVNSEPVKVKYRNGKIVFHNIILYDGLIRLSAKYELFRSYYDYDTSKEFYYANSIIKYILNNIALKHISSADFGMLFKQIKIFEDTNKDKLFDDEIKYYTKHKIYKALQEKYPEYNF